MIKVIVLCALSLTADATRIDGVAPLETSRNGSPDARAAQLTSLERQRLLAHLEMTRRWLLDEVSGLNPTQLDFQPARGAWSIRQVLAHLSLVGQIYWDDLQAALKTPPEGSTRMSDADILWYGIDRTDREQAIPTEIPREERSLRELLDAYRRNHDRLTKYIEATADDLRGHIVRRQGSDAYQWALLISTHEQRHIQQILEIKAHPRFPRP